MHIKKDSTLTGSTNNTKWHFIKQEYTKIIIYIITIHAGTHLTGTEQTSPQSGTCGKWPQHYLMTPGESESSEESVEKLV